MIASEKAPRPAFIPKRFPLDPSVQMDEPLWSLLSQADRALGRLDGSTETLPNPNLFVFMYVRKEAVLSSQIEGTQASLLDVLEFEADALETRPAAGRGRRRQLRGGVEPWPDALEETAAVAAAHSRDSRQADAQRPRRRTRARRVPPIAELDRRSGMHAGDRDVRAAASEMPAALGDLEKFLHDEAPMPALIKVGLAHAQFETIHPFLDGNGRVGRLLITFLLCEKEILKRPFLYLSYYFKKHRLEYYDRLQAIRDHGDWEGWLAFFLRGVFEVSQEAAETARKIVNLRERHRQTLTEHLGRTTGSALTLLESLYARPVVSVPRVAEVTGLAYVNAKTSSCPRRRLRKRRRRRGRQRGRSNDLARLDAT